MQWIAFTRPLRGVWGIWWWTSWVWVWQPQGVLVRPNKVTKLLVGGREPRNCTFLFWRARIYAFLFFLFPCLVLSLHPKFWTGIYRGIHFCACVQDSHGSVWLGPLTGAWPASDWARVRKWVSSPLPQHPSLTVKPFLIKPAWWCLSIYKRTFKDLFPTA